jgi:hypothetical protein
MFTPRSNFAPKFRVLQAPTGTIVGGTGGMLALAAVARAAR